MRFSIFFGPRRGISAEFGSSLARVGFDLDGHPSGGSPCGNGCAAAVRKRRQPVSFGGARPVSESPSKNIGIVDAYLRLFGGLTLLALGAGRKFGRAGSICAVLLGASKVAEGITRYCPMYDLMELTSIDGSLRRRAKPAAKQSAADAGAGLTEAARKGGEALNTDGASGPTEPSVQAAPESAVTTVTEATDDETTGDEATHDALGEPASVESPSGPAADSSKRTHPGRPFRRPRPAIVLGGTKTRPQDESRGRARKF